MSLLLFFKAKVESTLGCVRIAMNCRKEGDMVPYVCARCGRELWLPICDCNVKDPLDDDRDQENPCEFSEGYNFENWDFDSDPDWR